MKSDNFNIVSEWGVLSTRSNARTGKDIEVRLTKCSWFGKRPKWDLRSWSGGIAGQGVVIGDNEDLYRFRDLLVDICRQLDADPDL